MLGIFWVVFPVLLVESEPQIKMPFIKHTFNVIDDFLCVVIGGSWALIVDYRVDLIVD